MLGAGVQAGGPVRGWHSLGGTRCLRLERRGAGIVRKLEGRKGFGTRWVVEPAGSTEASGMDMREKGGKDHSKMGWSSWVDVAPFSGLGEGGEEQLGDKRVKGPCCGHVEWEMHFRYQGGSCMYKSGFSGDVWGRRKWEPGAKRSRTN